MFHNSFCFSVDFGSTKTNKLDTKKEGKTNKKAQFYVT